MAPKTLAFHYRDSAALHCHFLWGLCSIVPFHQLAFPALYLMTVATAELHRRREIHHPKLNIPEPVRNGGLHFSEGEIIHAIAHADNYVEGLIFYILTV